MSGSTDPLTMRPKSGHRSAVIFVLCLSLASIATWPLAFVSCNSAVLKIKSIKLGVETPGNITLIRATIGQQYLSLLAHPQYWLNRSAIPRMYTGAKHQDSLGPSCISVVPGTTGATVMETSE